MCHSIATTPCAAKATGLKFSEVPPPPPEAPEAEAMLSSAAEILETSSKIARVARGLL